MFTDRQANSRTTRREKQPWPEDKPFKILSLDGGGIKGVYTAELLARCEREFCGTSTVAEFFDMIAGTSTGGILALGLGLGVSTDEILEFYCDDGREIFPPIPEGRWQELKQGVKSANSPKLDYERLESALRKRFGERTLGMSNARLVIPAFMMPKTEIAVLKTDHHADFKNDHLSMAWKVARATSAAPTYLKGLEDEDSGKIFLDGGIWANNPVMVALVDVLSAYDVSVEQISILSVGTGNSPFELDLKSVDGGMWAWREVIKAAMFLTTDNATAQAKLLLGPDACLRLEPSSNAASIEMDDYDAAYSALPSLANTHFEKHKSELASFFQSKVLPRERHYSNP